MDYGDKLAPKSKADYAFFLQGFYHLKQTGTMAIVLPHGVLFRDAAEGAIREILLKNGSIYAIIGLPSNMFYNTSIPTCIVVYDYNLNIPRYVDTSEEEPEVDFRQLSENMKETNKAIKAGNDALFEMLGELTFANTGRMLLRNLLTFSRRCDNGRYTKCKIQRIHRCLGTA